MNKSASALAAACLSLIQIQPTKTLCEASHKSTDHTMYVLSFVHLINVRLIIYIFLYMYINLFVYTLYIYIYIYIYVYTDVHIQIHMYI